VSKDFENLDIIVKDFLNEHKAFPQAAAFGIPGPVTNGKVKSTNLPWIIDEKVLSIKTAIPIIKIVNDLTATAYEIPYLLKDEVITIKDGNELKEPERFVVLAPGTGLGQALCSFKKSFAIISKFSKFLLTYLFVSNSISLSSFISNKAKRVLVPPTSPASIRFSFCIYCTGV